MSFPVSLLGSDRLERHALLMLFAALCGHVGNYVFHTLTGRALSLQDYGLMVAVLGSLQILNLPLSAFNMAIARNAAASPHLVRALLTGWGRIFLGLSLLAAILLWIGKHPLLTLFSSSQHSLIPLSALLISLSLFMTLTGGILQGCQKFRWLAARSLSLFLLRALFCLLFFVVLGARAETALAAHLLAMAVTLALSFAGILFFIPGGPIQPGTPSLYAPVWCQTFKALPALAGFAILMSADVVLVRRYFPPETSGDFAQAAVLARMVLWLPFPIASAMYPKVIHPGTDAKRTLRKAAGYTLGILTLTLLGFWLLTPLLLTLLYGPPPPERIEWTRRMALAMAPLCFTHILLQFDLAQKRFAPNSALLGIAILYLLRVSFHHPDIETLINTLTLATLLSAGALLVQRRRA